MFIFAYDLKEHTKRKNNKNKLMSSGEQDRARSGNTLAGRQHCTGEQDRARSGNTLAGGGAGQSQERRKHTSRRATLHRLAFHYLPGLFQLTINPKYKTFKDLAENLLSNPSNPWKLAP